MTLVPITAQPGKFDRRDYDRRYYLAHRERKIEQAKASYRRRVDAEKATPKRRAGAPRFYATRGP